MLEITDAFRPAIAPGLNHPELRQRALRHGMTPLRLAGARKVIVGLTTLEELLAEIPPAPASTKTDSQPRG
ncbi:MAG: hypothetical protein ACU84Q_11950 [Gammaproteobacteria bacterium]